MMGSILASFQACAASILDYARARSDERCTAVGAGMLVVIVVLYTAQRFPAAEHAIIHYASLGFGAVISGILMGFQDRTLAWVRDRVLFLRKPIPSAQPETEGLPIPQKDPVAMNSFETAVLAFVEGEISKFSPAAQKAVTDIQAAIKSQSVLDGLQAAWDVAQVIHDLEQRLAALQPPAPAA